MVQGGEGTQKEANTRPWSNRGETTFDFPISRHYNVPCDSWKICSTILFNIPQHMYSSLPQMLCEIRKNDIHSLYVRTGHTKLIPLNFGPAW